MCLTLTVKLLLLLNKILNVQECDARAGAMENKCRVNKNLEYLFEPNLIANMRLFLRRTLQGSVINQQ